MRKKKQEIKQPYRFWRWLILSVARIKRLYFLAWGIIGLLIALCFKSDILALLHKVGL